MQLCMIGKAHSAHTAITGNFIEFRIPEFVFDFCKLSPRQLPFPRILREKIALKECCFPYLLFSWCKGKEREAHTDKINAFLV